MFTNRGSSFPMPPTPPPPGRYGGRIAAADELAITGWGDNYIVEGSGTITSLPAVHGGALIFLRITDSPTFVNSAWLICEGGANIVANPGDAVFASSDGSGVWRLYLCRAGGRRERLTAARTYYVRTPPAAVALTIASPGVVTWTGHGLAANAAVVFAILPNTLPVTLTIASPAVATATAHGYAAGQPIVFDSGIALPTGVTAGTTYYVIAAGLTANTFQFSATVGGAAVNTSGTQSGTHRVSQTGALPTGLTAGTVYYVVGSSITTNTFQVSATPGGAAINTTGSQSGNITASTGSDANSGLTSTAGGALLTIQKAYDTVCDTLDAAGFNITISVAGSVYLGGLATNKSVMGNGGAAAVTINGAGNNNTLVNTAGNCFDFGENNGYGGAPCVTLSNIKYQSTAGQGLVALGAGVTILLSSGMETGAFPAGNLFYVGHFAMVIVAAHAVSGNAAAGYYGYAYSKGFLVLENAAISFYNSPTFFAFLGGSEDGLLLAGGATFPNGSSVIGAKYVLVEGTRIDVGGADINFLPGTVAGVAQSAASYGGGPLAVSAGGTGDTGTAWTAYTPALSPASGTFTSASAAGRYKAIGKTVFVEVTITITTNGSAGGFIIISLPVTPIAAVALAGYSTAGMALSIGAVAGGSVNIFKYDATYAGGTGIVLVVCGSYEAA